MCLPLFVAGSLLSLAGISASFAQSETTVSVDNNDRLSTNVVGLEVFDGQKGVYDGRGGNQMGGISLI